MSVRAFKAALHAASVPQLVPHLYQCIAAMPDDPDGVLAEVRVVMGRRAPSRETVVELCRLYREAVTGERVAAVVVPDLAAMQSVGGIQ